MKFLQAGRMRIMIRQVCWITFFWTLVGALDALHLHTMSDNEFIQQTSLYNFNRFFLVNTLGAFFSGVFGDLMQGVDADVKNVIVLIDQPDRFLDMSVDINFFQTGKTPDAVIDMCNEITRAQVAY